jgi:hypothetical protein
VEWQRAFHLVRLHLEAGGEVPAEPGTVVRQGEDLGRWVRSIRLGWDRLTTVQQCMCEHILGITPATEDEKPKPRRTQAGKWARNYAAARQFFEREGHLRVPRKHVETIVVGDDGRGGSGEEQKVRELRLGAWIGNQRSWAATLPPDAWNNCPRSAVVVIGVVVTAVVALAAGYLLGRLHPWQRLGGR